MEKTMVILGLGSNVGDRLANLRAAASALSAFMADMKPSSVYESAALLPEGAPDDWGHPFLNMALSGTCHLAPEQLFTNIKQIEQAIGRTARGVWAPREIDIDILAIGNEIILTSHLCIPHKELTNRDFALVPFAEIAPDWRHPANRMGKTASDIVKEKGYGVSPDLRLLHAF